MNALVLYHSYGGNTKLLAEYVMNLLNDKGYKVTFMSSKECIKNNLYNKVLEYDVVMFGSNTWGDGELPSPMYKILDNILKEENEERLSEIVTGVFGTGETGYVNYCEAVNIMAKAFNGYTNLAVTLKVEQLYSRNDVSRITKFVELTDIRYAQSKVSKENEQRNAV